MAQLRGRGVRELTEDASEIAELAAFDKRFGLLDRWIETGVAALVTIANALGAELKLPIEQKAPKPLSSETLGAFFRQVAETVNSGRQGKR